MGFYMQFTMCFELYIDIERGTSKTRKLIFIIEIRTETRQKINADHCGRGMYLFTFICI